MTTSVLIKMLSDRTKASWIGQPHVIAKLEEERFGKLMKGMQTYQTPSTPGYHLAMVR